VIVRVVLMGIVRGVRDGRRSVHKWESDTQYWAKLFKRKAPKNDFAPAHCAADAAPWRESIDGTQLFSSRSPRPALIKVLRSLWPLPFIAAVFTCQAATQLESRSQGFGRNR
jgi:hypothetical protein